MAVLSRTARTKYHHRLCLQTARMIQCAFSSDGAPSAAYQRTLGTVFQWSGDLALQRSREDGGAFPSNLIYSSVWHAGVGLGQTAREPWLRREFESCFFTATSH